MKGNRKSRFIIIVPYIENLVIKSGVTEIEEGALSNEGENHHIFKNIVVEYNPNRVWNDKAVFGNTINNLTVHANEMKYFSNVRTMNIAAGEINTDSVGDGSCVSSIYTINIGKDVTNIDAQAFIEANDRMKLTVDPQNTKYHNDANETCIIDDQNTLILGCGNSNSTNKIPSGIGILKIGSYSFAGTRYGARYIPEGVTTICPNAFYGCYDMAAIDLPSTVTMLGNTTSDFSGLNNDDLCTIFVNSNNPRFSADVILYNKDKTEILYVPTYANRFTVADSVTTLKYQVFSECIRRSRTENSKISITLGAGITRIESGVLSRNVFKQVLLVKELYGTTWQVGNTTYKIEYTGSDTNLTEYQKQEAALEAAGAYFLQHNSQQITLVTSA